MTPATWGALLGAALAGGLLLVASRIMALRRPRLETRVLPYVRDLPQVTTRQAPTTSAAKGVFGPLLQVAADGVERVLGGASSVRRRLDRAGLDATVAEFRVQQVLWGLVAFGLAAAYSLLKALTHPGGLLPAVLLCLRRVRRRHPGARPAPLLAGQAARATDPRRVPDRRRAARAGGRGR